MNILPSKHTKYTTTLLFYTFLFLFIQVSTNNNQRNTNTNTSTTTTNNKNTPSSVTVLTNSNSQELNSINCYVINVCPLIEINCRNFRPIYEKIAKQLSSKYSFKFFAFDPDFNSDNKKT